VEAAMALTRAFNELMRKRAATDPAFRDALLREGVDTLLGGDVDTGKAILRDYIKAPSTSQTETAYARRRPTNAIGHNAFRDVQ
jgi:hypothetical protein